MITLAKLTAYIQRATREDDVEHDIRPPMRQAVTMPLKLDGKDLGMSVYVAMSSFADVSLSDADVLRVAQEVGRRINSKP